MCFYYKPEGNRKVVDKTDLEMRYDMSKIELRQAKSGDEEILAYIQTESWKAAFRGILSDDELIKCTNIEKVREMCKKSLSLYPDSFVIEFVDDKPHCIAGWNKNRCGLGENVAELICIHSLCDNWHKGYGTIMLNYILEKTEQAGYSEVVLWVFEKNLNARRFYEKHGFVLTEESKLIKGVVELMYSKKI